MRRALDRAPRVGRAHLRVATLVVVLVFPVSMGTGASGELPVANSAIGDSLPSGRFADVILAFEDGYESEGRRALDALGGAGRVDLSHLPISRVVLESAGLEMLATLPHLVSVTPNLPLQLLLDESTPSVGAPQAWETLGERGANSTVLVIDSGVDGTHPDLNPATSGALVDVAVPVLFNESVNLVAKSHVLDSYQSLGPYFPNTDTVGHGTHVASTIAGRGLVALPGNDPTQGLNVHYRGVAPEARVASFGLGAGLFVLGALQGFDYALAKRDELGIRVISNSWGPLCDHPTAGWTCTTNAQQIATSPVAIASRKAYEAGMVVVFAAGNDGAAGNTMNPNSLPPWVLSVAATTKNRVLADFSSRGWPGRLTHNHPDISAPGVSIMAARSSTGWLAALGPLYCERDPDAGYPAPLQTLSGQSPENLAAESLYQCMSGTSMATPHVSGAAALVASANPQLSPDQIMDILVATSTGSVRLANGAATDVYESGLGFLNATRAVEWARSTPGNREAFLGGTRAYSGGLINQGKGDFGKDSTSRAWYANHPDVAIQTPTAGQIIGLQAGELEALVEAYAESWALTVEFSLDAAAWETVSPEPGTGLYRRTWAFSELVDGSHTLAVRATTETGGAIESQRAFTVNKAPVCVFVSPLPGATLQGSVPFTAHWTNSVAPFAAAELRVDGNAAISFGAPDAAGSLTGTLDTFPYTDAGHSLQLRCQDTEGRLGTNSGPFSINNQMALTILEPSGNAVVSGAVPVRVQVESPRGPASAVELSVDGGAWSDITASFDGASYTGSWDSTSHAPESTQALIQVRAVAPDGPTLYASVPVWVDNLLSPGVEIVDPIVGEKIVGVKRVLVRAASNSGDTPRVHVNTQNGETGAWVDITNNWDGQYYYYDWVSPFAPRDNQLTARVTDQGGVATHTVRVEVLGYYLVRDNPLFQPILDYYECAHEHLFGEPYTGKPLEWVAEFQRRWDEATRDCQWT